MTEDIARELGSISAQLEHITKTQEAQGKTLVGINDRLHKVESRAALNGAVTAGVITVAISFIKDAFKS